MTKTRWIWIGGWGLPPQWLKSVVKSILVSAEHTVLPPTSEALGQVDWENYDRIGGYSLGSFLLLKHASEIDRPALLLAPFFSYPREAGLGGRISQTQLRYLERWMKSDPAAALDDFYRRSGLDLPSADGLPYGLDPLLQGLKQLREEAVQPRLPEDWVGLVGGRDPLLDGRALKILEPRLNLMPEAGHHPLELLEASLNLLR